MSSRCGVAIPLYTQDGQACALLLFETLLENNLRLSLLHFFFFFKDSILELNCFFPLSPRSLHVPSSPLLKIYRLFSPDFSSSLLLFRRRVQRQGEMQKRNSYLIIFIS